MGITSARAREDDPCRKAEVDRQREPFYCSPRRVTLGTCNRDLPAVCLDFCISGHVSSHPIGILCVCVCVAVPREYPRPSADNIDMDNPECLAWRTLTPPMTSIVLVLAVSRPGPVTLPVVLLAAAAS